MQALEQHHMGPVQKVPRRWTDKIHKKCDYCGVVMVTTAYRISRGMGKCCSRACSDAIRTGRPVVAARLGETRKCLHCTKEFYATPGQIKKGWGNYCSIGCSKVGMTPWNKTAPRKCLQCGGEFQAGPSYDKTGRGKYCSHRCYSISKVGVPNLSCRGKRRPENSGDKNPSWKGGVTKEHDAIRTSLDYKLWREAVYRRDSYTCQSCGAKPDRKTGLKIHAHHILAFADFPHKRTDISNGITLCEPCHRKAHGRKEKQI